MNLALVTGASSGLGKAISLLLARNNYALILTGRDRDALLELKNSLNTPVEIFACDLESQEERRHLIGIIKTRAPDLVINNAGFGLYGEALDYETERQSEMLEVNAKAVLEITLESARALLEKKKTGKILNVSSAAAFFSYPSHCVYAASKAFVKQFSLGIDSELKSQGVRVLCACPGKIETDFSRRASGNRKSKNNLFRMSAEKAARLIFYQIEKEKPLYVFHFPYRLALIFTKLIPRTILDKFLRKSVKVSRDT